MELRTSISSALRTQRLRYTFPKVCSFMSIVGNGPRSEYFKDERIFEGDEICAHVFNPQRSKRWEMQSSNQSRILPFRCTCSSALNPDARQESKPVLRRSVVSLMSTLLVDAATSSSSVGAKPVKPMMVEPDLLRFRKTPSAVRIQEVVDGSGPEAKTGDTLEFDFVCRRSNGYFVYSTVDQLNDQSRPAVLPLGTGKMIPGLEEVLAGMRPGGKRRALIPPQVGYIDTSLEPLPVEFGPRRALMSHAKEPLVFEVQLLKMK